MKKEDKNKFNIDEEIEKIKKEQNIEMSKEDEENLRNVLEFISKKNPTNKKNKIINSLKSIFLNLLLYIISYFALYGILINQIKYDSRLVFILFILILSLYQVLVKKLVFIFDKPLHKNGFKYGLFLLVSIVLLYFILNSINLIIFKNTFYLLLYYFGAEFIVFICKYYITKHTINKLLR